MCGFGLVRKNGRAEARGRMLRPSGTLSYNISARGSSFWGVLIKLRIYSFVKKSK